MNRVPDWLRGGFVSIGWQDSVHARPGMSLQELTSAIKRTMPDGANDRRPRRGAGNLDRFFHQMRLGDVVLTVDGSRVYIGRVTGEPEMRPNVDGGAVWKRPVEWLNTERPVDRATLPQEIHKPLRALMTLTNVTKHLVAIEDLAEDQWEPFLHWAQRLYERPTFDEEERRYKIEIAERVAAARDAFRGNGEWLPLLRRAFARPNNLTNHHEHEPFLNWCRTDPGGVRALLQMAWVDEEPILDPIAYELRSVAGEVIRSPAARLSLLSFIKMGIDAARFPFFRLTVYKRTLALLAGALPESEAEDAGRTVRGPAGLTMAEFDGIADRKLRVWQRFWQSDPARDARAEEMARENPVRFAGRSPDDYLRMADAEVAERASARTGEPSPDLADARRAALEYLAFIRLFDELRDRLARRGVPLRDRMDAQSLAWWVTSGAPPEEWTAEEKEAFLEWRDGAKRSPDGPEVPSWAVPPVGDDPARQLSLPTSWLNEIVDLVNDRKQIVFYGPPGTGKTLVAQRIGEHVLKAGGSYELVQFHPSYGYEDFFEGFRPSATDTSVGVHYEKRPGPLRRAAKRAAEEPEVPHLLVIDEINRGNVAKIFGELFFLLEYRDRGIPLQYSPDERFELPRNLFFIGTMNTADRSIALVDSALRRRFYFVPFLPTEEPIRDVLRKWLAANGLDPEPATLLERLNEAIDAGEFSIGPSYFIAGRNRDRIDLDRVWRYAIRPLLEEHFYGTGRDIDGEFGWDALRARGALVEDKVEEPPNGS